MNKPIWKRTAICLITIIILSVCILPLVVNADDTEKHGERWSKEAPNFSPYYTYSIADLSNQTIRNLKNGANFAYQGGMFGGGIPIAIIYAKDQTNNYIEIVVLSQQATPIQNTMGEKEEAINTTSCIIQRGMGAGFATIIFKGDTTNYPGARIIRYRICNNGDIVPMAIGEQIAYAYNESGVGYAHKIIAIRTGYFTNEYNDDPTNNPIENQTTLTKAYDGWYNGTYYTIAETDANHWFQTGVQTPASNTMEEWTAEKALAYAVNATVYEDGYDEGYDDGYEEGYDKGYDKGYDDGLAIVEEPVTLNIAGIFTSMFSGVRSIFNGFNINIFGISIAGMMLAILLISIIAFIVKKIK